MKITDVRTVLLTGPSTHDPYLKEIRKRRSAAFIEILTDTELTGLGETYGGYFIPEVIPEIVNFFKPILLGESVHRIDELWRDMYHCGQFWCRVGLGAVVLNGIEAALWDLKGKMYQLPVYELLGGRKHEALLCYATGGPSNYPLERLQEKIHYYLSLGFKAFKVATGGFSQEKGFMDFSSLAEVTAFEVEKMETIRSLVGYDVHVMLDGHMGNQTGKTWDLTTAATVLSSLEPYQLFFFEEPLHYTDPSGYARLCNMTTIPIAGGESLTSLYEWKVFVERDCFDIGQPDASFVGGLGEFLKVASLLGSRGKELATHSWGAGGSLMQNIHAGFACENTVILEVPPDYGPLHQEIIGDSLQMKEGKILPPEGVGLGITLTQKTRERYPFVPGSGEFNRVPGKVLVDE